MIKMPSAASSSSTQHTQSKLSSAVNKTRSVLAQARAKQQAHPDNETDRVATEAFKAYRSAVDARCDEINARFIELAKLRKQVGDTDALESEQAVLEKEFRELRNSLTENQKIQPETLGKKFSPIRSELFAQFCNTSTITINAAGIATPYPSNISVSGQTGLITSVTVTLNDINHTRPDDIDILLVGPGGQNAIIMSDVGGSIVASGVTLTLDDAAANSLPDTGPLVSGTFKPTNAGGVDIFPAPAPPLSGASTLGIFNGIDPNGTWSLYLRDDTGLEAGSIAGGWCLNITTEDVTPCTLTCSPDVTQANDVGQCGAIVTYPAPTSSGTCGTVSCSPASGSFFPIGTTPVTCSSTTGATCSFNVTVTGTCNTSNPCNSSAITINAAGIATPYPSNISVSGQTGLVTSVTLTLNNLSHTFPDDIDILLVGPGGQNAIVMSDVGSSTPVSGITLTLDDAAANSLPDTGPLVSGTFKPTNAGGVDIFPAPAPPLSGGSALSIFNGTDPNGTWSLYIRDDTGTESGSLAGGWCLSIMTADVTPCTLTCPPDVTQAAGVGQCGAMITYPAPTSSGTCGTVSCSPPSGSFFIIGTTPVTCSSTTGATCSFNVTITGTCPGGCNPALITINDAGVATPYPSSLAISGLTGVVSNVTVTLNNLSHTVPDDIDILLVGPGGQNAIIMSDVGGSIAVSGVTLTLDDAAANSLPDTGPLVSGTFKPTSAGGVDIFPPPAPVPSGASALSVFNGTDPNGTWSLYIRDDTGTEAGSLAGGWCLNITTVQNCTITCPANQTASNDLNQCGAVVNYPAPTTNDDCGTVTCTPSSGAFFPTGTTTVTCTTQSGPSCSFTVTVNDTQAPTITCPANQTVSNDPNQCGAVVNYSAPTVSDNCPGVGTPTCSPLSGSFFSTGTMTVNCTVNDAAGNPASCSFTVTVNDVQPPSITCPANITQSTALNQCSRAVTYAAPTVSDNCPGVGSPTCIPPSGSTFLKGTTTVNCTVNDAAGNPASCSFTVTINDTQAPTVTCPANIVTPAAMGQCSRVVTFTVTASDNCPGVSVVSTPPSGSTFPKGTTTVTSTATDASGNTATCSFTVTVVDTQPPIITCPANRNVSVPPGQPCGVVTYPAPTATDNCPGVTTVCSPPSGSCFPNGTTTVICTATDTSGNTASCSFTVSTFNYCLQDDDNPSVVLRFNSATGDYIFCCNGTVYSGNGTVTIKPNQIRLEDETATIKLDAKVQTQANKGSASLQPQHGPPLCDIKDKNLSNNTCLCP
ncbi:MAG: HYR domain-containing protein [Blastocatellia bacterium]